MPSTVDPAAALQHSLLSRLKLRQLILLQAVDRHRSLVRVADEMQLSQPAITKALHEVEDIFGSQLFARTSRGLVPTAAGEAAGLLSDLLSPVALTRYSSGKDTQNSTTSGAKNGTRLSTEDSIELRSSYRSRFGNE